MFVLYSILAIGLVGCAFLLILISTMLFMTKRVPNLTRDEKEKCFKNSAGKSQPFPSLFDASSVKLSVIVPAYNEEKRLHLMMDEALAYCIQRQTTEPAFTFEIIVVDDGSSDSTTEVAQSYVKKFGGDKVRVLTLVKNRGKGGAVRLGMLSGRGERLLFADADGATKFSEIAKLESSLQTTNTKEHKMAVVCGSRAHLEEQSIATRSVFRTILMYGFHFLVSMLCVRNVRDTQCGFKMFSRAAAQLLFSNMHVERWAFDVDLLHIAQHFDVPISEVAVDWHEVDGSKLSPLQASIQMARDLVLIRLRYLLGIWKMERHRKQE